MDLSKYYILEDNNIENISFTALESSIDEWLITCESEEIESSTPLDKKLSIIGKLQEKIKGKITKGKESEDEDMVNEGIKELNKCDSMLKSLKERVSDPEERKKIAKRVAIGTGIAALVTAAGYNIGTNINYKLAKNKYEKIHKDLSENRNKYNTKTLGKKLDQGNDAARRMNNSIIKHKYWNKVWENGRNSNGMYRTNQNGSTLPKYKNFKGERIVQNVKKKNGKVVKINNVKRVSI